MEFELPSNLRFIKELWKWGFWNVILCQNICLNNTLQAVKIIINNSPNDKERKNKEEILKQLKDNIFEASIQAYLNDSDYIVNIYEAEPTDDWNFLIQMEFLEQWSLEKILNENGFLNVDEVLKIAKCISFALSYAHAKKILHLDIKPWNILKENSDVYKLSDFWLSGIKNSFWKTNFRSIYELNVTPEYLSWDKEATEQSDIYMFWITLYRLLNWPLFVLKQFREWNVKQKTIDWKFPNRNKYLPHIPSRIIRIVNKCLNVDLNKRYKNMLEIRQDLWKINCSYIWKKKNISNNRLHWECFQNNVKKFDLKCEINEKGIRDQKLTRFPSNRKIKKYCISKKTYKQLEKEIKKVFNDFF